ncbi:hypothetical protein MPTK1_3g10825 [Marchantia polymorpha subsp. ruderalis]
MHLHESAVGVAWNAADEAKVPGSDQETSSSWSQGHRAKMFQSGSKHVGKVIMLHDPRDIEEDDTLPAGEVFISSKKGNVVFIAPYSMARMTSGVRMLHSSTQIVGCRVANWSQHLTASS